jgi:peptidoglycan glycosyltransferase
MPELTITAVGVRLRHSTMQLGGFFIVAIAILSLNLLRQQVVAANTISHTVVNTESGASIQDPRRIPAMLQVQRGSIFAGSKLVAGNEVIEPSLYVHRIYPEPNISYLAGYYNPTIYGTSGLERSLDNFLSGAGELDPLGDQQRALLHRPHVGKDVHLTIDPVLQNAAHDALGGNTGAVVLLDVRNGAILALASNPHLDPQEMSFNPYKSWEDENRRILNYFQSINNDTTNRPQVLRATMGLYPPGSTFKTVTAGVLLDSGRGDLEDKFEDKECVLNLTGGLFVHRDCPGCCEPRDDGFYTLDEAYGHSMNVVFARIGIQVGAPLMDEYARRFSVGTSFDIGVPMSRGSVSNDFDNLRDPDMLAATAYGQGELQTTPLHMALVAAAVARGGKVPVPYLVKSVNEPGSDSAIWRFEPKDYSTAVSERTAGQLRDLMVSAVEKGFVSDVAIEGYTVGGKTGTAENPHGPPHAWFIGWAGLNAQHPRFAISVLLENAGEGTSNALPVARKVLLTGLVSLSSEP